MISFTSIASSSAGNAYLVSAPGVPPLLIEAGLPIRTLRDKLREHAIMLTDLAGVLCSHDHGDHSKAVKDILSASVDCYMSMGTAGTLGILGHHRWMILVAGKIAHIGKWSVMPFALEHDAAEPLGFMISHGTDTLLFIPDTAFVRDRFSGVTLAAVECNHCSDILIDKVLDGKLPAVVGRRIRRNHFSLENLIAMLKSNDLSRCRKLYLLHLSSGNSDENRMKLEVQQATGIPTEVC